MAGPSYLDVVPVFEGARAGQPLDPVGQVEPEMFKLETPRAHGGPCPRRSRRDPWLRDARVRVPEPPQQRRPVQSLLVGRARRDLLTVLEEDLLRRDELLAHGLRRARPPVVEHARPRRPRPYATLLGTDPKSLRVLVGADLPPEPHHAHLATVPVAVRRDGGKVTVEMQIVDEQPLDPAISLPFAQSLAQGRHAGLVQYLVRLDVDSPGATAGSHRAVRLVRERPAAVGEIPDAVDDADPGVAQPGHDVARLVVRLSDVDDDFVAQLENRPNRRNDRVVERDRVPDDGEPGDHVRCGTACRAAGDTARPRRTASRGFPAPRSGPRRAPRSDRHVGRWRAGAR